MFITAFTMCVFCVHKRCKRICHERSARPVNLQVFPIAGKAAVKLAFANVDKICNIKRIFSDHIVQQMTQKCVTL